MKIVSLLPSATEIVCALGLREQLVGVTHECNFPESVTTLPIVTKSLINENMSSLDIDRSVREQLTSKKALYSLDMATLRNLAPDVIVTQALCEVCAVAEEEVVSAASDLPGPPKVLNLEPMCLDDVFRTLLLVGEETHNLQHAVEVVDKLKARVATVIDRTQKQIAISHKPRVVFLEWLDPLFNAGHWTPELIEYAGGIDALGNKHRPSETINWQSILDISPEVLFIACCGYSKERALQDLDSLRQKPGWEQLPCVRNGRIYIANGNAYFSSPSPRLVDSLELIANSLFPDIHPLPKHIEPTIQLDPSS